MRKIEIAASDERLITPSGLSLVGQVLRKSDMIRKANRMRTEKRSQPQIVIDGFTLLCTNQVRSHLFLYDRLGVRECIFIQQSHTAQERLCLTVVRCCRQEQQV